MRTVQLIEPLRISCFTVQIHHRLTHVRLLLCIDRDKNADGGVLFMMTQYAYEMMPQQLIAAAADSQHMQPTFRPDSIHVC